MKGARTPAGYTILEVMIVLAISGMMFLIAANFISGKEEAINFPQGVNDIASLIQHTIQQVSNGQYSDIDLKCAFAYNPLSPQTNLAMPTLNSLQHTTTNSITNDTQGGVEGNLAPCIYLGKVVQFNEAGVGPVNAQQYETFTLAGGRLDNTGKPVIPDASSPSPLDTDGPAVIGPLTIQVAVPEHLTVVDMGVSNIPYGGGSPAIKSYGVGFINNLGSTPLTNGAQPINLYYVKSLIGAATQTAAQIIINRGANLIPVQTGQQIVMCLTDQRQYALVEIGDTNSQLSVQVKMLAETACT